MIAGLQTVPMLAGFDGSSTLIRSWEQAGLRTPPNSWPPHRAGPDAGKFPTPRSSSGSPAKRPPRLPPPRHGACCVLVAAPCPYANCPWHRPRSAPRTGAAARARKAWPPIRSPGPVPHEPRVPNTLGPDTKRTTHAQGGGLTDVDRKRTGTGRRHAGAPSGGCSSTRGLYSTSWMRPSKVRCSIISRATSG